MLKTPLLVASIILSALLVAGCGGSTAGEAGGGTATTVPSGAGGAGLGVEARRGARTSVLTAQPWVSSLRLVAQTRPATAPEQKPTPVLSGPGARRPRTTGPRWGRSCGRSAGRGPEGWPTSCPAAPAG